MISSRAGIIICGRRIPIENRITGIEVVRSTHDRCVFTNMRNERAFLDNSLVAVCRGGEPLADGV
jgi:hypothetical protein